MSVIAFVLFVFGLLFVGYGFSGAEPDEWKSLANVGVGLLAWVVAALVSIGEAIREGNRFR